jgi:hypothetical protein
MLKKTENSISWINQQKQNCLNLPKIFCKFNVNSKGHFKNQLV